MMYQILGYSLHGLYRRCFGIAVKTLPCSVSHVKSHLLRLYNQGISPSYVISRKPNDSPKQTEVVLYECENSKRFLKLKLLTSAYYIILMAFGITSYDNVNRISLPPNNSETNQWLGSDSNHGFIKKTIITSLVLGTVCLLVLYIYILRNVKTLILKTDSREVIFHTYTPFGGTKKFKTPLTNVSGVISRHKAKKYIPLKIKNKPFQFLVSTEGRFTNPSLFDTTVALKRDFKKE